MEDNHSYWEYLGTLPRSQVTELATEELMDVKGLAVVKKILHKYNLANVTIDHKLNITVKRSRSYSPRKAMKLEQGKGQ